MRGSYQLVSEGDERDPKESSKVGVVVKDFYDLKLILRKAILRQTSWSHTAMKEKPRNRPRMPPNSATKKGKVLQYCNYSFYS